MTSRIAETIRTLDQLDKISLRGCGFDDEDAVASADTLEVNTSIATINLYNNQIGDEGATTLVDALQVTTSVTRFSLADNDINDSIIATIGELTDRNKRLQHLFLYDARRMLLSLMCADECGVVWPYLLGRGNTDGVAAPNDIDVLRVAFASIVMARRGNCSSNVLYRF
jgi:hypothetical protein